MSGLGRTLADLELSNARTMRAAQSTYDNMPPPEMESWDANLDDIIDICEQQIGRAKRALDSGDLDAARDLLIEAGRDLIANVEDSA